MKILRIETSPSIRLAATFFFWGLVAANRFLASQDTVERFFPGTNSELAKALNLNESQRKNHKKLEDYFRISAAEIHSNKSMPLKERFEIESIKEAEVCEKFLKLLDGKQQKIASQYFRFSQFSRKLGKRTLGLSIFTTQTVVKALELNDKQVEAIREIQLEYRQLYEKTGLKFASTSEDLVAKFNKESFEILPMQVLSGFFKKVDQEIRFDSPLMSKALKQCRMVCGGAKGQQFRNQGSYPTDRFSVLIRVLPAIDLDEPIDPAAFSLLLLDKEISKQLKLTQIQIDKIRKLLVEQELEIGGAIGFPIRKANSAKQDEMVNCQKISQVLDSRQEKKGIQIYRTFQIRAFGEDMLLLHPYWAKSIDLPKDELEQIKKLNGRYRLARQKAAASSNNKIDEEIQALIKKTTRQLTSQQKKMWAELTGSFGEFEKR